MPSRASLSQPGSLSPSVRFAASGLDRDQAFAEAVKWRRAIETLSPV